MTKYGNLEIYDSCMGRGIIAPEQGDDPLRFEKSDLQQEDSPRESGLRLRYETRQAVRRERKPRAQARQEQS